MATAGHVYFVMGIKNAVLEWLQNWTQNHRSAIPDPKMKKWTNDDFQFPTIMAGFHGKRNQALPLPAIPAFPLLALSSVLQPFLSHSKAWH